jgi:hypothetical protein
MAKEEELAEMSLSDYESPSWAYKHANRLGAMRAYKRITDLFKETNIG